MYGWFSFLTRYIHFCFFFFFPQIKIVELQEACQDQEEKHKELTTELKTLQEVANQHPHVNSWSHNAHTGGDNSGKKRNNHPHNTAPRGSPVHGMFTFCI